MITAGVPTGAMDTPSGGSSPISRPGRPSSRPGVAVGDAGSASLFLVISMLGLLVLVGLVVDGGVGVKFPYPMDF